MTKIELSILVMLAGACLVMQTQTPVQGQPARSVPAKDLTIIKVSQMHCENCAKNIAGEIYKVAGVAKIQVDVKKKLLWVQPAKAQQPSPRLLWEAVEKAYDRPVYIQGPRGKFTSKPRY